MKENISSSYMCYPTTKLFGTTLFRCIQTLEINPKSMSYNLNRAIFVKVRIWLPNILMCLGFYGKILTNSMTMSGKIRTILTILRRW